MLHAARQRAGLSQADLATRAGTSQATVSDIERGKRQPTVETLDRLLRGCGRLLVVWPEVELEVDPHDASLFWTTLELTPAQRLRGMTRLLALKGLARR